MLKQIVGIIKMVAETPTEQNREMLRKISSIDGKTDGELVDWGNVFEIIDNLYSGFYTKVTRRVWRYSKFERGTDNRAYDGRIFDEGNKRDNRTDYLHNLCKEILDKKEARSARKGGYSQIPAR